MKSSWLHGCESAQEPPGEPAGRNQAALFTQSVQWVSLGPHRRASGEKLGRVVHTICAVELPLGPHRRASGELCIRFVFFPEAS
eukprot:366578-Chlamydomonas_euryale.AAC.11